MGVASGNVEVEEKAGESRKMSLEVEGTEAREATEGWRVKAFL